MRALEKGNPRDAIHSRNESREEELGVAVDNDDCSCQRGVAMGDPIDFRYY